MRNYTITYLESRYNDKALLIAEAAQKQRYLNSKVFRKYYWNSLKIIKDCLYHEPFILIFF